MVSTALRLFGRLDILSNNLALPARRSPCSHARLRSLATKLYEISGLTRISKIILNFFGFFGRILRKYVE